MAPVDVQVETTIHRPVEVVAGFAGDPGNAPEWYANIRSARWRTGTRPEAGAEIDFVARFLGRELRYTYRIVEHDPGRVLVMETAQGPFPMRTTYTWTEVPGGTRMTLANAGEPSGFAAVARPVLERAMRRATTADLARLRGLLEGDRG